METTLLPGYPGRPSRIMHSALGRCVEKNGVLPVIRGGFAYATLSGARILSRWLDRHDSLSKCPKEFIVGVHHGITEPSAMEALSRIPYMELRAIVPEGRMSLAALYSREVFHPKVLAISDRVSEKVTMLSIGSANLSSAAMGSPARNIEFNAVLHSSDGMSTRASRQFNLWWSHLWRRAVVVNQQFIRRYADTRAIMLEQNPVIKTIVPPSDEIGSAETFFIDVGAASGPPGARHQVEFPRGLARYFGRVVTRRRDLVLWNGRRSLSTPVEIAHFRRLKLHTRPQGTSLTPSRPPARGGA